MSMTSETFLYPGMSTLPEVTSARHCGMTVFAMSLVTNMVVLQYDTDEVVKEDHVVTVGEVRSLEMQHFMLRYVSELSAFTQVDSPSLPHSIAT